MVTIEKCPCGHPSCSYYGVSNGTFYQGNGWEKPQAEFIAWCFNTPEIYLQYQQSLEQEKSND